ncbi:MAG: YhdT family protein [Firmicutes bacterium]|nr:YhdT family protein [Bacillota bacterium]
MKHMTQEEKHRQIRREAKATFILFFLCFAWHVGFGYALNGVDIRIWNLPLWWIVSTPGVFLVAVIGVIYLLTKVFVNFDLEPEVDEHDK